MTFIIIPTRFCMFFCGELKNTPQQIQQVTLHSKLITPPLDPGGGWQPSVIRQRGGVGLLNVHLCAWGWGWRASVMQHPGGVGVLDGTHGLGVGLGKLVRVGLGRLLAEGGEGELWPQGPIVTISISNAHPQSPYPLPQSPMSPNAHSQSKYPQILRAV